MDSKKVKLNSLTLGVRKMSTIPKKKVEYPIKYTGKQDNKEAWLIKTPGNNCV